MSVQTKSEYEMLLSRLRDKLGNTTKKQASRLELPTPQTIWVGQRTIFRNFMDFPKALNRDPEKLLLYLNKDLLRRVISQGRELYFWEERNLHLLEH